MRYPQPYQTIRRRVLAAIIDLLLWLGVLSLIRFIDPLNAKPGYLMWVLAVELGFYVYLIVAQAHWGTTLGKSLCGLEIANWRTGGLPTYYGLLKRYSVSILLTLLSWVTLLFIPHTNSAVPFETLTNDVLAYEIFLFLELSWYLLLLVAASQHPFRRGWHDRLGDTLVIRKRLRFLHARRNA